MCFGVTLLIIYVSLLLTLFFTVFFFFFLQYIPRTEDHVLGIVVDYKADVSLLKSLLVWILVSLSSTLLNLVPKYVYKAMFKLASQPHMV